MIEKRLELIIRCQNSPVKRIRTRIMSANGSGSKGVNDSSTALLYPQASVSDDTRQSIEIMTLEDEFKSWYESGC